VALPGLSTNPLLKGFNRVYVELVRAVPILVMILWVYYGMPQLLDVTITVFWAGVIALALSDSAFEAIDKGQYEASHTVALGYTDTMRFIILPQAIKRILPALGNQLVYMLKMSSLVSVIGMQELTGVPAVGNLYDITIGIPRVNTDCFRRCTLVGETYAN